GAACPREEVGRPRSADEAWKGRRLRGGALARESRAPVGACEARRRVNSAFRTWNGVERHTLFPGVTLQAIGGEQALMCHVVYSAGTTVARHAHPESEQLMWIVEGDVTMTWETRRSGWAPAMSWSS